MFFLTVEIIIVPLDILSDVCTSRDNTPTPTHARSLARTHARTLTHTHPRGLYKYLQICMHNWWRVGRTKRKKTFCQLILLHPYSLASLPEVNNFIGRISVHNGGYPVPSHPRSNTRDPYFARSDSTAHGHSNVSDWQSHCTCHTFPGSLHEASDGLFVKVLKTVI